MVGKNGAGKTTLFKIITKEISPESGDLSISGDFRIAYLSQHFDFDDSRTIRDICLDVFKEYYELEERIIQLNAELEKGPEEDEMNRILEELDVSQNRMNAMSDINPLSEISRILKGLGFKEEQFDEPVNILSGGWKMRVQIAKLLLKKPDLLLLDEPDNHLDLEALIWFEKYIKNYPGAVLFISHDVEFMSNTAQRILELANRKVTDYKVGYRKYLSEKDLRKEKEEQAYLNQQKEIKTKERTITRFMAKASKTKMAQSMQKQLDKIEKIEIENDDLTQINIQFPGTQQSGKRVLTIQGLNKSFGDKNVIRDLDIEIDRGQKIAFVGQNGEGKSTLVKLIAGIHKANSGSLELGHNVIVNYFAQNQSEIFDEKKDALETVEYEADSEFSAKARQTLGAFAFSGDDVYKKVSVLSGGEKSRLAMACMVSRKSNFLLLDEPTNHLDIQSKAILKSAIENYPGTLIIVSHDREILRGIIDTTYEFRDGKIYQHLGDLDYVLAKRESADIRDFESNDKSNKVEEKATKESLSYHEQKQLNRKISKIEKSIDRLEKEIKELQNKLMDIDFYNSEEGPAAVKQLNQFEAELEDQNLAWDKLVSSMDQ